MDKHDMEQTDRESLSKYLERVMPEPILDSDKLFIKYIDNREAATYTLEGLKTAYSKMTFKDFLKLLDGREDQYWEAKWQDFRGMIMRIDALGTFFPILVNHGHELRNKDNG